MITVDEIPEAGILLVTIHFKGYKDSFANDARRKLLKAVPGLDEELQLGLGVTPLLFSLVRTIADGIPRATGAQWQFGYSNMTPDKFRRFYGRLKDLGKNLSWWDELEVMVATDIGGLDE